MIGTTLLRGLVRAGKAQRRSANRLVKILLAAPKLAPKAKKRAPASRPAAPHSKLASAKLASVKVVPPRAKLASAKVVSPRAKLASVKTVKPAPGARLKAAPATAPLPGKWLASHYSGLAEHGGLLMRRMSYWLYLPDRRPAAAFASASDPGLPLIVMLHGCDQTATQFAQGTHMNQLAEQKGYAVLYPQQLLRNHPNRCWKWYDKATQAGGGDVKMIVGMIEKIAAQYRIDKTRIYICGISAGAAMANIVALNHPQLIAAVGLHSAPMFGAGHNVIGAYGVMQHGSSGRVGSAIAEVLHKFPEFPSMPAILIQGLDDKVVRPVNQTQLAQQSLLLNGIGAASAKPVVTKPAGRPSGRNPGNAYEIRDFNRGRKVMLRVAQIARLEHAWSGGDPALAHNSGAGPDASKMMLDFFARHQRVAPRANRA
jgi:poly(hydroxyalkanoate) depolymerase family esterase